MQSLDQLHQGDLRLDLESLGWNPDMGVLTGLPRVILASLESLRATLPVNGTLTADGYCHLPLLSACPWFLLRSEAVSSCYLLGARSGFPSRKSQAGSA